MVQVYVPDTYQMDPWTGRVQNDIAIFELDEVGWGRWWRQMQQKQQPQPASSSSGSSHGHCSSTIRSIVALFMEMPLYGNLSGNFLSLGGQQSTAGESHSSQALVVASGRVGPGRGVWAR